MDDYRLLTRTPGFLDKHRVKVTGSGGQTVVLGNGFGTDQGIWDDLLPWLERRCRVVRFDWTIDPRHYDANRYSRLDSYAEDMLAVIDATSAAPCILIGHSMSAMIGMLAALREPKAFRRMVMIAPAPRYVSDDGYEGGFDRASVGELLRRMGESYMDWVVEFAPIAVGDPGNDRAIGEFSRSLLRMRPDVALSMAHQIFLMDLRDKLDGFTIPTTIIQPTADPAVPQAVGHYLARRWPHACLEIIDAAGHFPHLTEPEAVTAILARTLPG